ncbi:hypothetical protein [Rhodoferax sp. GW822-FHT02A01]|uniref:hypothetical protein n=1 Tax=Rhodoferax sp. GW822-FHT02A01 TaxID=3141537 RepID=UPI00315D56A9
MKQHIEDAMEHLACQQGFTARMVPSFVPLPNDPFIRTMWTASGDFDPSEEFDITPEQAKGMDTLFRAMVLDILNLNFPGAVSEMVDSGVKVYTAPRTFNIILPNSLHVISYPEVAEKIVFIPWAQPHEAKN